jgi:cobalamin biosynthesis Mg chelatase CobN
MPNFSQSIEIVGPSVTPQGQTSTTESSAVPATTDLPPTTQTTAQPATTTVVVEPETSTTTQPAPTGGGFPTEMLAIVAVVLIVIIAGAVYALGRRK